MKEKIGAIHLVDFEEVMKEAEKLEGLSEVCVMYFIHIYGDDILRGALECLADEAKRLSEHCYKLMQEAEE